MKVYFVGAGPGDPDLITVKGRDLLATADVVIYAGSLINTKLLDVCGSDCERHDSAALDFEQVTAIYDAYIHGDAKIVRLHSGEPSLYSSIKEQMDWLEEREIQYEIVPGVSSFGAAAAAVHAELTLPGVSQTVIISRAPGRTPVPVQQQLRSLAQHNATMCIFLSVQMIDKVVAELSESYPPETPVAVVERASWPDQRVIEATLGTITGLVKEAGIQKTAMIIVGDILTAAYERSKLYDPNFKHAFRPR